LYIKEGQADSVYEKKKVIVINKKW
jgi:hypothetical protein